jgi:L-arabinose isomerase
VRLGLAVFCADWFRQVGLQTGECGLAKTLQDDYARIVAILQRCFDQVVTPGVIFTAMEAAKAVDYFCEASIDALLLVHIMWSEDQPLLEVLHNRRDVPVLLWNYHPTGVLPPTLSVSDLFRFSGTVGMLQGSAPMERLGIKPRIVSGSPDDPNLAQALCECNAALRIRKMFQGMRAARIAGRCEVMTGTYVNAESLHNQLGVELVEISAAEYAAICEAVDEKRIEAFGEQVAKDFTVTDVSANSLRLAYRNTLALDDLVMRHDVGAVAIQDLDPELHRLVGIRPCLCPPISAIRGVAFGMESDLNTTLGLLAAMQASSVPCMFTEIFTYDQQDNTLLMGHAGVHDPRLAGADRVTIVPDAEYRYVDRCEGAWQEFIFAPGPITCVSLYDAGSRYRMTVFEGESLGPPRRLQGFAHALVRPDLPVETLLPTLVRRGMTQHFAVAQGHIAGILEEWCRMVGLEFHWEKASSYP